MVKEKYSQSINSALTDILQYWMEKTPDHENGGFLGKIDNDNIVSPDAPKGSVLNARILWSFAAAYNHDPQPQYLETAERAYHYIAEHFVDNNYGGVYWTVDAQGNPLDTKKQVYAIAFTIYAFSEYFIASGREVAKDHAVELYQDLIKYSLDKEKGGYFEAFGQEWESIADLRLSDKDANEKKTMNTHLHVLEGFANLYRIWPDEELKNRITDLLKNFTSHMIDSETGHLKLFFDEDWNSKSAIISYGHDIEAAWLLLEAAEVIEDPEWIARLKDIAVKMAYATTEGMDKDGGLWYEKDPKADHIIKEKHWWVQAEAMVGFYNAWQISHDPIFLDQFSKVWDYTQKHIIDDENGEWFWGIGPDGQVMAGEDKAGLWKCPYHNSRACIEILKRL
ncbi:AGE family epimerase/isomerase [Pedobacter psychroterrae]|uniref:Cellobiose 2-epimerase n=1 Tax=Pedobacter psychroterrae TaxID=2530453 RepID=A0A4R0NKQ4_9SPHI|nr:AGE family epimerase/isomerase [Pedobacter psychroterrae]TCD01350.1 N-acyl-D-glucosamine 2-epimerase [Pedobacter psychroterrae]